MNEVKNTNRVIIYCIASPIVFILLCLFTIAVNAQTDTASNASDSLEENLYLDISNAHTEYFTPDELYLFKQVDTSLYHFQKFNPVRNQNFEYAYLGNFGAPYYPRYFEFNRTIGFDYGRHERDLYLLETDEVPYFRTTIPYTDLTYVIGTNSEQFLHAIHSRNFGPNANVAIGVDKIASTGYYQHMLNDYINVFASGWYQTKNKFYQINAAGIYSSNENQENGGILPDTVFDMPFPNLADPFRTYAFTEWNSWQGNITQALNFGEKIEYNVNDTTTSYFIKPIIQLREEFTAHIYNYLFEDLYEAGLYGDVFMSGDTMRDRSKVNGITNKLALRNNWWFRQITHDSTAANHFNWEISALQQYHIISDAGGIDTIENLIAGGNFLYRFILPLFTISMKLDGGYDIFRDTYDATAKLNATNELFDLYASAEMRKLEPAFTENSYNGFNLVWQNDFKPVEYSRFIAGFKEMNWQLELEGSLTHFDNYIYYITDSDSGFAINHPAQFGEPLDIFQAQIMKNFIFWYFHIDNRVGYQIILNPSELTPRNSPILLPEFLLEHSFYFKKSIFGGNLFTQMGFDVWYSDSYYGYKYNLNDGQFGVQRTSDSTDLDLLTFYPVIDVFASFDIRTFRFFIKCDYINQGLFSKGYFEAPKYPMQPRGVKFGVNWKLFY